MSQEPEDLQTDVSIPYKSIQQKAENSHLGGGQQAIHGHNNTQIQDNRKYITETYIILKADKFSGKPKDTFSGLLEWLAERTKFLEGLRPAYFCEVEKALQLPPTSEFTVFEKLIFELVFVYCCRVLRGAPAYKFRELKNSKDYLHYVANLIASGGKLRMTSRRLSSLINDPRMSDLVAKLEEAYEK